MRPDEYITKNLNLWGAYGGRSWEFFRDMLNELAQHCDDDEHIETLERMARSYQDKINNYEPEPLDPETVAAIRYKNGLQT